MAEQGCPLWMMSFGDCMSLLVTFFVMLIAFTNMEEAKLVDALNSMKGALGVAERPILAQKAVSFDSVRMIRGRSIRAKWLTVKELSSVLPDAEMAVKRFGRPQVGGPKKTVFVAMVDEGLAFVIHATSVFDEQGVALNPGYAELWEQIGGFVSDLDNEVRIVATVGEGMKTNAVGDAARTPLGLCFERAGVVEGTLRVQGGLSADRFSIAGKVLKGPSTEELPLERVEIIVMGKRVSKALRPEEIIVRDKWD